MFIELEVTEGEWFPFFSSKINPANGEIVYEDPVPDAKVQIRRLTPFWEEKAKTRKKVFEMVYNPKTRGMERVGYQKDETPEKEAKDREDAWDYAITGLKNFKDSKTKAEIPCNRKNKIALMANPVFARFFFKVQEMLDATSVKEEEAQTKNSSPSPSGTPA